MNSAPACIILEQLGARGVELGGGKGGDEEEGELRKQQPYQYWLCCGGRGVAGLGEEKLQLLPAHSYGRNFFPIRLFIQLQNFIRD